MFVMLKDAGLSPDLCSYAAALQCMGRRDQDVHIIRRWVWSVLVWPVPLGQAGPLVLTLHRPVPRCLRCLKEMVEAGFQPQQLFTDLDLAGDERAALLRAVLKAEPAFSLPPQAPDPVNTSTLLKEIYAKVSPTREAATTSGRPQARLAPSQTSTHKSASSGFLSWVLPVLEPCTVWPFVSGSLMTVPSRSLHAVVYVGALLPFMAQ